jgi:hypothetical protein
MQSWSARLIADPIRHTAAMPLTSPFSGTLNLHRQSRRCVKGRQGMDVTFPEYQ